MKPELRQALWVTFSYLFIMCLAWTGTVTRGQMGREPGSFAYWHDQPVFFFTWVALGVFIIGIFWYAALRKEPKE